MKVKELIEKLEKFDGDLYVWTSVDVDDGRWYCSIVEELELDCDNDVMIFGKNINK